MGWTGMLFSWNHHLMAKRRTRWRSQGMLYYCTVLTCFHSFSSFCFLFLLSFLWNISFVVIIHHYLGLHIDCSCIFRSVNEIMYQLNAMPDAGVSPSPNHDSITKDMLAATGDGIYCIAITISCLLDSLLFSVGI